ncbi:MAG: DUF4190 domain-containing protein, partial [Planctomycetota bacterium]|nr:DUF4190 domain-containing protein [Planctomycetota bacterium]
MSPAEPDNQNESWDFSRPQDQPPADEWNPYTSTTAWSQSGPTMMQGPTVSALSILSMISGIVSIPLICTCFVSIPFSVFAIVAGHISRGICRRSQGRVTGSGMAVAGLSMGYVSLLITASMFAFVFAARFNGPAGFPGPAGPVAAPQWTFESDGAEQLNEAIATVSSSSSGGNSEEATDLALHLQSSLHDVAQQLQSGSTPTAVNSTDPTDAELVAEQVPVSESPAIAAELPERSGGIELQKALRESTVYCALNPDSCAFLVAIRNLSELNEADRETLSQMIWLAAGRSADGHLDIGDRIAVALIHDDGLQEISLGNFERSDQYDAGLEFRGPPDNYDERVELES